MESSIEVANGNDLEMAKENPSSSMTFITLEIYYARYGLASSKPYLREPIKLKLDIHGATVASPTFRQFLREGIYSLRPELKYADNEVCFYQTPNGTNLLSLLDESVAALPHLLAFDEQALLKVIIKRNKPIQPKMRNFNKSSAPQFNSPEWPKTPLESIPEDKTIRLWKGRLWINYEANAWRRRFYLMIGVAILLIASLAIGLGVALSSSSDPIPSVVELKQPEPPTLSPSLSPVFPPTLPTIHPREVARRKRMRELTQIVSTISTSTQLDNPNLPQRRALLWLAEEDGANLADNLCPFEVESSSEDEAVVVAPDDDFEARRVQDIGDEEGIIILEDDAEPVIPPVRPPRITCIDHTRVLRRYALAVLYFSTSPLSINTGGGQGGDDEFPAFEGDNVRRRAAWSDDFTFLSDKHECSWHRNVSTFIGGEERDNAQGVICYHGDGGYIMLDEYADSKVGWITLNLTVPNELTGRLPSELGSLMDMRGITIQNQEIIGQIPQSIAKLSNLTSLTLSANYLTGPIPASIGALSNLTTLVLGYNVLSGVIPNSLGALTNLDVLSLGSNGLSGKLPPSFSKLNKLHLLHLSSNKLTGTIPEGWGDMSRLSSLFLDSNSLSGTIDVLGESGSLSTLQLRNNSFTGTIPSSLFSNSNPSIPIIADFANNNFQGNLTGIFGGMEINPVYFRTTSNSALEGNLDFLCDNEATILADCKNCNCCTACCIDNNDVCDSDRNGPWIDAALEELVWSGWYL